MEERPGGREAESGRKARGARARRETIGVHWRSSVVLFAVAGLRAFYSPAMAPRSLHPEPLAGLVVQGGAGQPDVLKEMVATAQHLPQLAPLPRAPHPQPERAKTTEKKPLVPIQEGRKVPGNDAGGLVLQ